MQSGITKGGARKLTKCVTALLNRSSILDEIILILDDTEDLVDTRKLMCDLEVGQKDTLNNRVVMLWACLRTSEVLKAFHLP